MIKSTLYPKTERVKELGDYVNITEKIDGSNLVFFKKNEELWIGLRNNIVPYKEIEETKDLLYGGLYNWLKEHGEHLQSELNNNSAICGEWIGMGCTKYPNDTWTKKWYMFAKANVSDEFKLYNLKYNHDLFAYPFISCEIPEYLGTVPVVADIQVLPTKNVLDKIYEEYTQKVNRPVEGFVMNYHDIICKYVRLKKGKLVEYRENDRKGE